ncbi:extracellular solute-binding protein [Jiangella aurantiaca]|uniref:Extracellular solute-binding protein n=1 Tax=Jiangella aurantiaca TaxID=2530373 RepID=A0A4R5A9D5_9ACTN|nr:extracellular solute-binding protein [Jiangella aurantiaca]TDD67489.1 extracellular solute-binding protein [Jiangella aurantiaca]
MKSAMVRLTALVTVGVLASSCGIMSPGDGDTTGSGDDGGGSTTMRVACFGNDQRIQRVEAAVTAFEQANDGVDVQLECTGFAGYFDKLATQFAAGDAPDVIMLNSQFLGEYAERGALAELGDSVDTSRFSEVAAAEGTTADGRYGVAAGLNTMTILANTALFEAAGVELPDDTTWTWDEYATLAATITEKSGGEQYGSDAPNFGPALEHWLRQQGKEMFTDDGELGFAPSDVADFLTYLQGMGQSGGLPPASLITEQHEALEQSGVATNKDAMGWFWSSAVGAITKASGADIVILRPPSTSGSSADAGLFFKPDSLWSVNADSENAEEATAFIDFMVNSTEAGQAVLTSLGVPANSDVRDAIAAEVSGSDKAALDYVAEISDELGPQRPASPSGAGTLDNTFFRHAMEVLYERASPDAAAEGFVAEMTTALEK